MITLAFAEGTSWLNYPGLELWKFINLAIFIGLGIYILRRPISGALSSRGEAIKQELIDAQEQKARALAKVAEADSLLSRLETDVRAVREHSRQEVESERDRLAAAASREIEKLKQQGEREVDTAAKVARKSLRQFLAQKSVDFARHKVRTQIKPEDDRQLIENSIGELRRARV
jgi:F0F1-type ATP synthase membrane subunit b/b'